MGQFNRILAALLILLVISGLALLVFSRLGLLKRITERNPTSLVPTTSPVPTIAIPTPTTPPAQGGSLLGFLFKSQKEDAKITITPPNTPTITIKVAQTTTQTQVTSIQEKGLSTEEEPLVTIIPYGATEAQNYPATGSPTILLLIAPVALTLGKLLRKKTSE